MKKLLNLSLLLFLIIVAPGCTVTATDADTKNNVNQNSQSSDVQQQSISSNIDRLVHSGEGGSLIIKQSTKIAHDPNITGIYKEQGSFNNKKYYKHQSKNYYVFWDTGKDYGDKESEQHTGGHKQWDLSDRLGGDEIVYSISENVLGDWSSDMEEGAENNRTGIVKEASNDSVVLSSSGQIDIPHDSEIDGIYIKRGTFNGKSYYKHQNKSYYMFWDTGKDYGAAESEQHTGGHSQWDLSDRLGGNEIIYSASENVVGDWLAETE